MLHQLHPDVPILRGVGEETRLVVSEPLADLPGAWNEVPGSTAGVIRRAAMTSGPSRPPALEGLTRASHSPSAPTTA